MKIRFVFFALFFSIFCCLFWFFSEPSFSEKRQKHAEFLKKSPFKTSLKWTKSERKARGLPPNKYFERQWELTMHPETGQPTPEKTLALLRKRPRNVRFKVPGGTAQDPWIERGPNNIGGRTRTLLFDPNDSNHQRVFAGGVSGGLWVNENITDPLSTWTAIQDVPSNMAVTCITVDPNNSETFYLGTGELYTAGAVTGNGIYKSTNGGMRWTNVFGGNSEDAATLQYSAYYIVPGQYFIQDIIAWNHQGVTKVFAAVGASNWSHGGSIATFLGNVSDYGVYMTDDGGANWTKPTVPLQNGHLQQPNDFEIASDNTLWLATTSNYYGDPGGSLLKTVNGTTFETVRTLPNLKRTELEVSATDPSKIYVLASTDEGLPILYKTDDAFASFPTEMALPEDADPNISSADFARGQSFYNLMIEVDPSDDDMLYVGGIDLFRSSDGAASWTQISKWNSGIPGNFSVVHADQHAMVFRPENPNQAIFGNDGGVYFASDLSLAATSDVFQAVNSNYNVTQFYTASIAPSAASELFMGGTQDNGTPFFLNPNPTGTDQAVDISGGDGGACFFDQEGEDYFIVSYVYNADYSLYDFTDSAWRTITQDLENTDGDFINQADLDSHLDILYTNGSNGDTYRIYRYSDLTNIPVDGAATKTVLDDPLLNSFPSAIKVCPYTTSSTKLFVGTETGQLFSVENADGPSPTWEEITGPEFLGSISDIELGAHQDALLVTFHNYGVDNVWTSSDGGTSWTSKEGNFPDIPVKCILKNPLQANEAILGTELGVWKTQNWGDASPTWSHSYNGMSDVKITDLQYREDDHTVLAATYGRGLFTGVFQADDLFNSDSVAKEAIRVYPNPVTKELRIGTQNPTEANLYDPQGILVLTSRKKQLDLEKLSSGTYLLQLKDLQTKKQTQHKIIKR